MPDHTPPPYYSAPPAKSGKGCLWLTVILLSIALIAAFGIILLMAGSSTVEGLAEVTKSHPKPIKKFSEVMVQAGDKSSSDRILQIDLEGPIFSDSQQVSAFNPAQSLVDTIKRSLAQAVNDPKVKAIVLRVNSPGGEVTASDNLYAAVKAANAKKPIVVFMDSVAASGGYYAAAPATKIIANETTLTGSIGVIMQGYAYHGIMDKVGLGTHTFTSGKFKDTLSGARPMREDEKAYIQNMVDQMYERFLTVVAEGRKIDKETLRNGIADGRVMGGKDALQAKLVDQLGYIEDAYNEARKLGKSQGAMVIRYKQQMSLFDAFGIEAEAKAGQKIQLHVPGLSAMHALKPGCLYYMTPMMAPVSQ
jgi:protease IV